jgi:hypothetical protein
MSAEPKCYVDVVRYFGGGKRKTSFNNALTTRNSRWMALQDVFVLAGKPAQHEDR